MDEEEIVGKLRDIIREHSLHGMSDEWETLIVLFFWERQGLRWVKTGLQKLVPPSTIIRLVREKCLVGDTSSESSCVDMLVSAWRTASSGRFGRWPQKAFMGQEHR